MKKTTTSTLTNASAATLAGSSQTDNVGATFSNDWKTLMSVPKTVTEYTIPDGVITIGSAAFKRCTSLSGIVIPRGVSNIEEWAFAECSSIRRVDIPSGVKRIDKWAFAHCDGLRDVKIPEGLLEIERRAFSSCLSLVTLHLPDTVAKIGHSAFAQCNSLVSVRLPLLLQIIRDDVFAGCDSIQVCELGEACSFRKRAFPADCRFLTPIEARRIRAQHIADSRAADGVDSVG
jgi:hypothetical protein